MSKFSNPVVIKISREDLMKILTRHLNNEIFRSGHKVSKLTMHVKGPHAVTMTVDPIDADLVDIEDLVEETKS